MSLLWLASELRPYLAPTAHLQRSAKIGSPEEGNKFSYIWEERERLERCKRVILATDNDQAGEALAEEIARRWVGPSAGGSSLRAPRTQRC